jgi:tetratricopeptide (TPR) repeat protein
VAQYAHDLAQTRANKALQLYQSGRNKEAEKDLVAVVALFEALHRDHPREHEYLKDLSIAHHTLGTVHLNAERLPQAKKELTRALELRRQLVREHGGVAEYQELLAGTLATLAQYHWHVKDRAEAAKQYAEARKTFERLAEEHPDQPAFTVGLAQVAFNQALFAFDGDELKAALGHFTKSADLTEGLLKKGVEGDRAGGIWMQSRRWRVRVLTGLGRFEEAVKEWEHVFELVNDDELRAILRPSYALSLARAGDHVRAAAEAQKAGAVKDEKTRLMLARAWAVCLKALKAVADERQRERLAKQYAGQAMKLLGGVKAGRRRELEKDADFEALRGRPEWKSE